jgi:hypothetical protein
VNEENVHIQWMSFYKFLKDPGNFLSGKYHKGEGFRMLTDLIISLIENK